ncbi:MAG: aspartyl protease family protein [Gemmataceae bacterium]
MSFIYRYRVKSVNQPIPTLGGRWSRPRPLIVVSLLGVSKTIVTDGLLDTGADDTVFPEHLAAPLGIDLSNAPSGYIRTATLMRVAVRYARVRLRITDGVERREWPAWVDFSPSIQRPLLGFAGFLQFFSATFHGDREKIELTVNGLYPGT